MTLLAEFVLHACACAIVLLPVLGLCVMANELRKLWRWR